jgi:hypothetical protein
MSSTSQLRPARRFIPAVVIVLGLLFISAVMIQQVAAQDNGGLKPPFKLNRSGSVPSFDQNGPVALPLNAPIIMSQTFNSTYTPIANLNQLGWHEAVASGATNAYTWRRVTTAPLTDTVWSAGSSSLSPVTGTYTNGQQSLLIYGPLNLSDYTQLVMTGTYWLDTAPGDYMGVAYSTDGINWDELYAHGAVDPSLAQAHIFYASLNQAARKPVVWIALTFVSNNDNLVGRGAFVRDVVLRGNPSVKIYLPLIRLDPTPTPTATPQAAYVYNYTFGSGLNTDPQFIEWGGKVVDAACFSTDAGGCKWGQDIITNGNPGGAMTFYQTGLDSIAGASPNNTAPTDFELSADFYVLQGKSDARLGLVFDTSSNAFGRDNDVPYFDPNRNLYKFDLQFNEVDNTVMSYYRLQKCGIDINACTNLVEKSSLPGGLVGITGTWNNIKIQRLGSSIKVLVNGTQLINVNDGTYVGAKKYGLFLQTKRLNSASNPIKIRFDNVRVRPLP